MKCSFVTVLLEGTVTLLQYCRSISAPISILLAHILSGWSVMVVPAEMGWSTSERCPVIRRGGGAAQYAPSWMSSSSSDRDPGAVCMKLYFKWIQKIQTIIHASVHAAYSGGLESPPETTGDKQ